MNRLDRKLCALFAAVLVLLPAVSCKKESNEVQSILFTNIASNKLTLTEGEDFRVKYLVEPYELQETAVLEWSSSKNNVATVRNGRITTGEVGRTTITATCGKASSSFVLDVVEFDVTSFKIPQSISGYIGASVKVEVSNIYPEGGSVANIDWKIVDESVATCEVKDNELYVTGVKQGTTKLVGNGLDITRECEVVIKEYVPVTSVKVTLKESSVMASKSVKASLEVLPSNASIKDVEWSVTPSSYASFDPQTMTLTTGYTSGVVTLTATAVKDEISGSASLTITDYVGMAYPEDAPYGHICPDGSVGNYPKTIKMTAYFSSANKNAPVKWKSNDTSRATVDQDGVVTAVGHGPVYIYATAGTETFAKLVRPFKLSEVNWTTYNCWNLNQGSWIPSSKYAAISSLGVPGPSGFCIIDPAAWYVVDVSGQSYKRLDYLFYYYVDGKFQIPEVVAVPKDFKLDEVAGGPGAADELPWGVKFTPLKASKGTFTVDMGIGNPVNLEVSAGVGSVSLVEGYWADYPELLTISLGGSGTFDKSDYRMSGLLYPIGFAVNYGRTYDDTWNSSYVYKDSDVTCPLRPTYEWDSNYNLSGGYYYYYGQFSKLYDATSGSYEFTMETPLGEFDPGKELSFTLNIVD